MRKFNLTEIAEELTDFLEDEQTATVNEKNEIVLPGCPQDAYLTFRRSHASGHVYADIYYPQYDEGNRLEATDTWRLDELSLKPTSAQVAKAVYDNAFCPFPNV